jgi:hypothetical protein
MAKGYRKPVMTLRMSIHNQRIHLAQVDPAPLVPWGANATQVIPIKTHKGGTDATQHLQPG